MSENLYHLKSPDGDTAEDPAFGPASGFPPIRTSGKSGIGLIPLGLAESREDVMLGSDFNEYLAVRTHPFA